MSRGSPTRLGLALSLVSVAAVTFVYVRWLHVSNPTTVSMTFLVVVLVTAATSRLWVAIVTSLVAVLAFNFFFLPPIGTLTIADPHNWVALFAFLAVSLVASNLSAVGAGPHAGGAGTPRRAGAPVRPEPRHSRRHREPRGHLRPRALARQAVRPRFRRHRAAARRRLGDLRRPEPNRSRSTRGNSPRHSRPPRPRSSSTRTRRTYAGHREMTVDGTDRPARSAARGHQADRHPRRLGPSDRGRHARHARRCRGDCDRTRPISGGTQER